VTRAVTILNSNHIWFLDTRAVETILTDLARWSSAGSYEAFWDDRAQAAASLLGTALWVCDLGCGAHQPLRRFLPGNVHYLPADLVAWSPEVAVCDLNANRWPGIYLECCDIVYILGVLEYLRSPEDVLSHLAKSCPEIVISYNPSDLSNYNRDSFGWVNSFSRNAFVQLLQDSSFDLVSGEVFERTQIIVRARSTVRRAGDVWRRRMSRWLFAMRGWYRR